MGKGYGCAKALNRYHKLGHIIAFEPGLCEQATLSIPATWSDYAGINFEFIPLFVGSISNESTITLDKAYEERPSLHGKPLLIKVDVEGSEVDVLGQITDGQPRFKTMFQNMYVLLVPILALLNYAVLKVAI